MKFDRETVLGILFSLYLNRSGRTTIENASLNLNCSPDHLSRIAHKLAKKGVIKSKKGPKGGYEIAGDPTIVQVVAAVKGYTFIKSEEKTQLRFGEFEQRALSSLFMYLTKTVDLKVSELVKLHSMQEKEMLDSVEGAISQ